MAGNGGGNAGELMNTVGRDHIVLHIDDTIQQPNAVSTQVAALLQDLVLQYLTRKLNTCLRYLVGRYLTAERIEWCGLSVYQWWLGTERQVGEVATEQERRRQE